MWRILVSFVTALRRILGARLYSRPSSAGAAGSRARRAPPAAHGRRGAGQANGQEGERRRDAPEGQTREGSPSVAKPGEPLRPGWSRPRPATIPRPTYWPVIAALAVTFIFWGMVTSIFIGGLGLIVLVIAAAGWIGDLVHES